MKLKHKLFVPLLLTASITISYSQEQYENLSCKQKVELAKDYFTGRNGVTKDPDNGFDLLKDCINNYDADALDFLSVLYLGAHNYFEVNESVAYNYMKIAADKGNANSACNMGIMQKMGRGTQLDFDKALESFQKAYTLGSDKAAFEIGYLYYKGLGSIDQDYKLALEWFQKSTYDVATHFVGIMRFYGYGTTANPQNGLQTLKDNHTAGSDILRQYLSNYDNQKKSISVNTYDYNANDITDAISNELNNGSIEVQEIYINAEELDGEWQGKLVEYDWSRTEVLRSFPVSLALKTDVDSETMDYTWNFDGKKQKSYAIPLESNIYFDNLTVDLKRLYPDAMGYDTLKYLLLAAEVQKKKLLDKEYLIFNLDTQNLTWTEPGEPMQLILEKETTTTNNGYTLTDELINSLAANKSSFINLYPNPFKKDLLIEYNLTTSSNVSVTVHNYEGQDSIVLEAGTNQEAGKHIYHLDGTTLKPSLYVVKVTTNDKTHTKLVIKEN